MAWGVLFLASLPLARAADPPGQTVEEEFGLTREAGSLPVWTQPDARSLAEMGPLVRQLQQGVFIVGHPQYGHGTAFVISRAHRLLATNAHVADILRKAGSMRAHGSGAREAYAVKRVWYHPGVVRQAGGDRALLVRREDPDAGPIAPLFCPDVAVLQLEEGGSDLPVELTLATREELQELFAATVGIVGYPGHSAHFPAAGELEQATFHQGVISRVASLQGGTAATPAQAQLLQHTAQGWGGFSGSPLFLPNGHVIGLHHASRSAEEGPYRIRLSHGVRIDCLWELLVYHDLDGQLPQKIDRSSIDLTRFSQPDPNLPKLEKVVQLLTEIAKLATRREYAEASTRCNEILRLIPDFPFAYGLRSSLCFGYVTDFQERLSPQDCLEQCRRSYADARRYITLAPADPWAAITLAGAINNLAAAEARTGGSAEDAKNKRKQVLELCERVLAVPNLSATHRAEAFNWRAAAREVLDDPHGALADYAEAIRLSPDTPDYYENRAAMLRRQGRRGEAAADLQKAEAIRQRLIAQQNAEPAPAEWHDFTSREGRFRVQVPFEPDLGQLDTERFHYQVFQLPLVRPQDKQRVADLAVLYADLSAEQRQQLPTAAERLQYVISDQLEKKQVRSKRDVQLGRHPGLAVEFDTPEGDRMLQRLFIVGDRLYLIAAACPLANWSEVRPTMERFLQSFTLLDAPAEHASAPREPAPQAEPRGKPEPHGKPAPESAAEPAIAGWRLYRNAPGGFRVLLPTEPKYSTDKIEDQQTHTFEAADQERGLEVGVSYLEAPAAKAPTPKARLQLLRNGMLKDHRLLKERALMVSEQPALELTLKKASGDIVVDRLVVADQRMYHCMAIGSPEALAVHADAVRAFLDSFALFPATKPELRLVAVEGCYGRLGPAREITAVSPYDNLDVRGQLEGCQVDDAGRAQVAVTLDVKSEAGEVVLHQQATHTDAVDRDGRLPFYVTLNAADVPGRYELQVTFVDQGSQQQIVLKKSFQIKPLQLAAVAPQFFRDREGKIPAPAGGKVGETLFFEIRAVGFDRSQGRIDTAFHLQLLDAQGKPVLPKAVESAVRSEDPAVVQKEHVVTFLATLPLTQAGTFTLRILILDRVVSDATRFELPLVVAEAEKTPRVDQ